jgi:uncharacterized membrane protein
MSVLGWVLMVIGVLFIVLSLIVRRNKKEPRRGWDLSQITRFVEAVTALIQVLVTSPWLFSFLAGLILLYVGARLQAGQPIIPGT